MNTLSDQQSETGDAHPTALIEQIPRCDKRSDQSYRPRLIGGKRIVRSGSAGVPRPTTFAFDVSRRRRTRFGDPDFHRSRNAARPSAGICRSHECEHD